MPKRMTRSFYIVSDLPMLTDREPTSLDSGHGGQIRSSNSDEASGCDDGEW